MKINDLFENNENLKLNIKEVGGGYRLFVLADELPDYSKDSKRDSQFLQNEQAIGYADLDTGALNDYLWISQIYVATDYQRKGIAKEIYNKALEFAHSNGYKGIVSDPDERNEISDKFWKKYGQGKTISGYNKITRKI